MTNFLVSYVDFEKCTKANEELKKSKLPVPTTNCELNIQQKFLYLISNNNIGSIAENNLRKAKQDLQEKINQERLIQDQIKHNLKKLMIEDNYFSTIKHNLKKLMIEDNYFSTINTNLTGIDLLEYESNKTKALKEKLNQKLDEIEKELKQIEDWLQQFQDLELADFYNEFLEIKTNTASLIDNYSRILALKQKLKIEIESQFFIKNPKSDITSEDLFRFRYFDPPEFKQVFDDTKWNLENVLHKTDKPSLSGNTAVDEYIFALAEKRGYRLTPQANEQILVGFGEKRLQPLAKQAFENMRQSAEKEGINLILVSGYRDWNTQKQLFWSRFQAHSISKNGVQYSFEDILTGKADKILDEVLQTTSVPSYSRHHSGYTIDIKDDSVANFILFKDTRGYEWISANNYLNAKRFGFIPSYPAGLTNMGPNPEEWEYVWVGVDNLIYTNS